MALTEEEKERAKKLLDDYFKAVAEGAPFTAVFTTDGDRRLMFTSSYPLPKQYLEKWEDDRERAGIDLRLWY